MQRKYDLVDVLSTLSKFTASLAEALASGPYFKVMLVNLLPYWIIQPWVDAAFKKRGIDPEEFWRNAGLPSFRFPDPNGQRQANGAPPPAPTPLEGTPEHPGPAVIAGTPCSYAPDPDNLPTSANPMPCARYRVGPFGNNPYGANYGGAAPDVVGAPPNPAAPSPAPGVPSAAFPGEYPSLRARHPAATVRARPAGSAHGPGDARSVGPVHRPGILAGRRHLAVAARADRPAAASRPGTATSGPAGSPPLPGNPPFLPPGSQG